MGPGRPRTNPARIHFSYNSVLNTSTCKILGCGKVVSGDHGGNLERHLRERHPEIHAGLPAKKAVPTKRASSGSDEDCPKKKTRQVDRASRSQPTSSKRVLLELTAGSIMKSCVKLVMKNVLPFKLFDDSAFREIIDPVLRALGATDAITAGTVKKRVQEEAKLKREEISRLLCKRMVSLKIDFVSRDRRALLGINVQYVENGRLILQLLAMKKLPRTYTSEHLTSQVRRTLSRYDISVSQVYSVTTNDDADILRDFCLRSDAEDENQASGSVEDAEGGDPASEADGSPSVLEEQEVAQLPGAVNDSLLAVRCPAHTLQLAVSDAVRESDSSPIIGRCHALVYVLRKGGAMEEIRKRGLEIPVSDNSSNWTSTFDMLTWLIKLKDFTADFLSKKGHVGWTDSMWGEVEMLAKTLQPVQEAMKALRTEQLTLGDFYGAWLTCLIKTKKIESPLAKALVQSMENKQREFWDTNIFCAALYMDPRYHFLLSDEHKRRAITHLTNTWERIAGLEQNQQDSSGIEVSAVAGAQEEPDNVLEVYLAEEAAKGEQHSFSDQLDREGIKRLLERQCEMKRVSNTTNVLTFWEDRKRCQPQLCALAEVALAVPATEDSEEHAFSALKFISSDKWSHHSSRTLDDLLLLRSCSAP